jgi:hypothetical protein
MPENIKKPTLIIGLSGCYCHPYSSWEECNMYHNQKLPVGTPVQNRHSGKVGTVDKILKEHGFVIVKYGDLPKNMELEHVANLIKIFYANKM